MIDNSFLILTVLFVVSAFIRTAYEILKDAGKIDPESKPVFALIFTVMCILWVSWFSLCPMDPFKIDMPNVLRWSGLALFVTGMILALGALSQLRGLENIDHLVTSGLFSKIRHPMYTGFVLWILGWSVYHSAIVSLLAGVIGIVHIFFWRRWEEARLLTQYGDIYKKYRGTTWF